MANFPYPPSPDLVEPHILAPSGSFKKQVGVVTISIMFFFVAYILLVLLAVALACTCFYLGVMLIIHMPKLIIIMIALGLMGLGVSVVIFLVKFIFAVSKNNNPSSIEIKEEEQPELFSFIRKLSKETKTHFPKKIFLSCDVNACVFYNSGFWSMFFPVRKNLEIGLGLVNSVNVSEFKAVIAHEFGHFSQRSMKLGSFTYNVNQIIHNMLYNNTGYTQFLNSWGNVSSYFSFFAAITIKIAQGIQWILGKMYAIINKSYFGLSREMEFHADAVSASVSGGNNLISALSRIDLASNCYNTALNNAGDWLRQKKVTTNIYNNQLTVLHSVAQEFNLPLKGGLPEVSYQFMQSFSQPRVNFKNQWASHPTLEERKNNLDQLNVNVAPDVTTSWELFSNKEVLQEQLTEILYKNAKAEGELEKCDGNYFKESYTKKRQSLLLPQDYKGVYDGRYINVKDWDFDSLVNKTNSRSFAELYNDQNGSLQSSINNNENDKATLKAIKEKQIDVKSFDFDGTKYGLNDCDWIIKQLEDEIQEQIKKQEMLDKDVFVFFYNHSNEHKQKLRAHYFEYSLLYKQYEDYTEIANGVLSTINPFYYGQHTIDDIKQAVQELKTIHEKKLKEFFTRLIENDTISNESENLSDRMKLFVASNYNYFVFDSFQNKELDELSELTLKIADEINNHKFQLYKKLLENQLLFMKMDSSHAVHI